MSQFHLKFSFSLPVYDSCHCQEPTIFSFGLPVYDSCHCQEPTIGRRSPFSMHQALRKKPADSWHQRSWNLVLGFLGVVVVFESVGKGPGRKLSFGVDQNIQNYHPFIFYLVEILFLGIYHAIPRYVAPLCFEETMMSQPPSMSPEAEL